MTGEVLTEPAVVRRLEMEKKARELKKASKRIKQKSDELSVSKVSYDIICDGNLN